MCGGEGARFFRRRLKEVNGEQKMGKGGRAEATMEGLSPTCKLAFSAFSGKFARAGFFNKNDMSFSPLLF